MAVEKLASVLEGIGVEFAATDVMDMLWLASHMSASARQRPDEGAEISAGHVINRAVAAGGAGEAKAKASANGSVEAARTELYVGRPQTKMGPSPAVSAIAVSAPEAGALNDKLNLLRSLKALKRRKRSPHEDEIDEIATAQLVAESGLWIPATKPRLVRWMDLALIIDSDESMELWRQTAYEFRTVLENLGAFRDIRVWFLAHNGSGLRIVSPSGNSARSPRELIQPAGDRLVMIFSDCVGPRWQSKEIEKVISWWARCGPVAIAQPLPQRLWAHTSINFERVRLRTFEAGIPNSKIHVRGQDERGDKRRQIPIPIVELSAASVSSWSRVVTASGGGFVSGSAMLLGARAEPEAVPDAEPPYDAPLLIERFELVASPNAMRLAECLAAAPVSIPVMRLIQDAILGGSDQAAVAEVFLGGLLCATGKAAGGAHGDEQYEFVHGVRELLLARLPRSRALEVLLAVADAIGARLGRSQEFRALITADGIDTDLLLDEQSRPFALVAEQVLAKMGTDFAKSAMHLKKMLHSDDRDGQDTSYVSPEAVPGGPAAEIPGELEGAEEDINTAAGELSIYEIDTDAAAEWRAFNDALTKIAIPRARTGSRSRVCPYCYEPFSPSEILFRCQGDSAPERKACVPEVDPVLQQEMNISTSLLPVFGPAGRREEARCPQCRGISRSHVCPHCHSQLPPKFQSFDSRLIALIGSSEAGKTAFMTVLIHELRRSVGSYLGSSAMAADETTEERFVNDYDQPLYRRGELFERTTHARQQYIRPLVFQFTIPGRSRVRSRNQEIYLSFGDSAGEDLVSLGKLAMMARYLSAADAILIMIDPLQLQSVRQQISEPMAMPMVPKSPYDPAASLERITRLLTVVSKTDVIDKPVAVTITKLDALSGLLPRGAIVRRPAPLTSYFDLAESDAIQEELHDFLERSGGAEINRTIARKYSRSRYFAVSALGAPPTPGNTLAIPRIEPHRIADPILWVLSEFGLVQQRGRGR